MSSTKKCYVPNGQKYIEPAGSPKQIPCDPTGDGHSACCDSDAVCLSNGLCFQQNSWGNRITRETCTDQTWQDPACPQYCDDVGTYKLLRMYVAEVNEGDRGPFCCDGVYNDSSSSCPTYTHGSNQPIQVAPGYVLFPNTSLTLADYKAAVERNITAFYSTATSSTTAGVTAATSALPSTDATCESARHTTAIGAGIGVSLGVILILTAAALIWQWRRANGLARELEDKGPMLQSTPSAPYQEIQIHEMSHPRKRHELGNTPSELI